MLNDNNNIGNDWKSWSVYVINTLKSLQIQVDNLEDKLNELHLKYQTEITELKTNSKLSAAIVGIVVSILVSVISGYFIFLITDKKEEKQPVKYQQEYQIQQQQNNYRQPINQYSQLSNTNLHPKQENYPTQYPQDNYLDSTK